MLLLAGLLTFHQESADRALTMLLLKRLTIAAPPRVATPPESTVLYVMGGTESGLERKFRAAARLYRSGAIAEIQFLAEPGITAYDARLRRNLTNEEWCLRTLSSLGVPSGAVRAVRLQGSPCFGTLAEARAVRARSVERPCAQVVLVTSPLHARRSWQSFRAVFGTGPGPALALELSDEAPGLGALVLEYTKVLLYENVVLPLSPA